MPNPPLNHIALIIPTLNEAANIVRLIETFQSLPYNIHCIVADSTSPDGTAAVVKKHFPDEQTVTVLNCDKRGRGASIVFAYRWIKQHKLSADAIAVSDADSSHDPKDLPKFIVALNTADVVIGRRYGPGAKIIGWPWQRRIFSRAANTLARILLHVGITDYTNGYRLFRRNALDTLDLTEIDADGYIHLSQELLQWHRTGLTITEVPTTFVNRQRGTSNFKLKLVAESLWVIVKLAWQHHSGNRHLKRE
ncbi:MAG: hypothetical protein COT71_02485 [Candidatus Andersenbacteria bacterium CG10_big_fil_rev_8_21_14_0_10_54_11]|uniref:Glycosyltransferase 2-like domain-containing protein n=1 Tax=Candidatus Andersenbacteria bacterium CG10_big_fil_rev_8_21_14_0_10_54_11 TaxID=1974485 RepID=A0A2M6WZB8_9BACT|nr:MAG: hypothetical protein COT71_02485 [Candidatus Andersenbacteria bacterium CG10_big_fil_rev_8_21_14_0_10_54_11]